VVSLHVLAQVVALALVLGVLHLTVLLLFYPGVGLLCSPEDAPLLEDLVTEGEYKLEASASCSLLPPQATYRTS
jgi:hypothetical protein